VRLGKEAKLYLHSSYFIAGALDNSTGSSTSSVTLEAGANFTFDSSSFCDPLPVTCEAEAIVVGDVVDADSILSIAPCVVQSVGFHQLPDAQKNTFSLCSRLVFSFHFNNSTSGLLIQIQLAPPRSDHMHTCSNGNISIGISYCNQTNQTNTGQVWQRLDAFSASPLQLQYLWNSSSPSLPTPKVDQDYCVTFRSQNCGGSPVRVTITSELYPTTITRGLVDSTVPSLLNVQNVGISYLLVDEWNQPYQLSTTCDHG
jgi:hypothetical protein